MSKTKLVFLAMGNAIICAQAFLMIGLAMADSRVVLQPGIGALVAALVLFVTSGVNMTAIYEMQRRAQRRREAAARRAEAGAQMGPQEDPPPDLERDVYDAVSREMAESDQVIRAVRRVRRRRPRRPAAPRHAAR